VGSQAELLVAAERAAELWAPSVESVELLQVSENAVYKVRTSGGQQFVLRLHRPGYNTPAQMRSEVAWVQALRESGAMVAEPLPTLAGEFYVPVQVTPAETRQAGAVGWIDGEPLGTLLVQDPSLLREAFHAVGTLCAQLRRQATSWDVPSGFVRRRWDANGLMGDAPLWGRFWDAPALTDPDRATAIEARDRLRSELAALPTDRESFGVIHADLHVNNVLRSADGFVAIDFDDAGFGWYVWDIAVAFQSLVHADPPEVVEQAGRNAFVTGYRSVHPLSDEEVEVADALCVARGLSIIGWMDARPEIVPEADIAAFAVSATARARRWLDQ